MAQRGFTMVELVVTMIIIGIMAIAVLPRMDLLRGWDEVGYRDKVKATLEYARKSAVAGRRYVCVTRSSSNLILTRNLSDPDGLSAVAAATCPANSGANQLALPASDTRYCPSGTASNQICAPSGVTLTGSSSVIFGPLGRSGGATFQVQVGSSTTATIAVEAETGYVHE
jgi:MSHA pilin protein MshC